jgi:hypothetical protein
MDSKESDLGLFLLEIPLPECCDRDFIPPLAEHLKFDETRVEERWRRWLDIVDR